MGGDRVSDNSAGAGEGVGRIVNGAGFTSGSIASGGGSSVGAETRVDNELARVRGFSEDDRGLVRRSWVDGSGEMIWKPSLHRIIFSLYFNQSLCT